MGDRYGAALLDVLICMHWLRTSDDPLLTVSGPGSSRHLARVWPALELDHSLVRYVQLVGWRPLPGTWPPDPSLSVGLNPMLLWSTLVVSLSGGFFVPKPSHQAARQRSGRPDLRVTIRHRLLVSVAIGGCCYSLGYSAGRPRLTNWLQTNGTSLLAVRRCSSMRMRVPPQGGDSSPRLLYLTAVRR